MPDGESDWWQLCANRIGSLLRRHGLFVGERAFREPEHRPKLLEQATVWKYLGIGLKCLVPANTDFPTEGGDRRLGAKQKCHYRNKRYY